MKKNTIEENVGLLDQFTSHPTTMSKSLQSKLPKQTTAFTSVCIRVENGKYEKLKALASREHMSIKDVLDQFLGAAIAQYEKAHGVIESEDVSNEPKKLFS